MNTPINTRPACDNDCAMSCGCRVGGIICKGCGGNYCADEINSQGYCDRCAEWMRKGEDGKNE